MIDAARDPGPQLHLRALAQRIEVDTKEPRIMGSESALLRTLVAAESAKTAGFAVPSSVPNLGRQNNLDSLDCNYWDFFPLRRIKETACQERLDETKRIAT